MIPEVSAGNTTLHASCGLIRPVLELYGALTWKNMAQTFDPVHDIIDELQKCAVNRRNTLVSLSICAMDSICSINCAASDVTYLLPSAVGL